MKKLEEISEINGEGKIIDMSGDASAFSKNSYILMDTNELYYYELEL